MLSEVVRVRCLRLLLTLLAVGCAAPTALAEDIFAGPLTAPPPPSLTNLEVSFGLGLVDRGTTGIGDSLLGHGYDHAVGAGLELDARVLRRAWHRYVRHGAALRLFHQGGRTLGVTDADSFQVTGLDLAYALRSLLPCISGEARSFHLTLLGGLSALHARAGDLHVRGDQTGELSAAAHGAFDHDALGAVLGLQFDMRHGPFLLALSGDLREHFALGTTPVSRDFTTSLTLRAGIDLDL